MQMLRSLNYTIDGFLQTEQHFKDALFFGNIILIAHTMVKNYNFLKLTLLSYRFPDYYCYSNDIL
jgi:hypothetical protein